MRTISALIIFAVLVTLSASATGQKQELLFTYEDKEVYPYYLGNGSPIPENKPGISIEVLRLLEKELGLRVRFIRLPWNRCKSDLKKGKVDGIFNASYKNRGEVLR